MTKKDERDTAPSALAQTTPEGETPGATKQPAQPKKEVIKVASDSVQGALSNALKGLVLANMPGIPSIAVPVNAPKASLTVKDNVPAPVMASASS